MPRTIKPTAEINITAQLTYGNHTIYTFQQVTNSETVPGSVVKLAVKEDGTVSAIFSGLVQGESKEEKLLTEEEAETVLRSILCDCTDDIPTISNGFGEISSSVYPEEEEEEEDLSLLEKSILFALMAHEGVKRKGKDRPYILHPIEVMTIVAGMTDDEEVIAAAVLHDTVEDTGLKREDIAGEFGDKVACLVVSESEDKREYLPAESTWLMRKQETIEHIQKADRDVKLICLGDKLANLRELAQDYAQLGDSVWERFNQKDKALHGWYYGSIYAAFPVNSDVQQAEKQGIFLSSDVITTPMYLIYTGDYANLNLRRIGVKRENSIGDIYVRTHYPHMEMVYYDDIHDMLDAVKRGAVDGCILNQFRRDAYLIRAGYRDLQSVALKDYISLSFAVKKGNSELLSILNRGITRLPSDFGLTSTYAYTGMMAPMTFRDYLLENLLTVMLAIGIIIAILSSLVAYIFLIHRNKREMQYIAQHDGLTGLLNRHCYNDFLNARQQDYPQDNLVVISMDLNGLKGVNDTMGHEAGDELIMGAAGCMKEALSAYGSVYRTGGDEFVAIIETPQQGLPKIIQSLKERFDNWHGKWNKSMSVSLGTAHNSDSSQKKLHELLALADQEMYKDKAAYYSRLGIDRRRH